MIVGVLFLTLPLVGCGLVRIGGGKSGRTISITGFTSLYKVFCLEDILHSSLDVNPDFSTVIVFLLSNSFSVKFKN